MPKPCSHDSHAKYELLIGPLRERARELGYSLSVHGTLRRDIDLVACPWTAGAVSARRLAEQLCLVAERVNGYARPHDHEDSDWFRAGCPGSKPHGRLAWAFHLGGGPYIDLSVMPRDTMLSDEQLNDFIRETGGTGVYRPPEYTI